MDIYSVCRSRCCLLSDVCLSRVSLPVFSDGSSLSSQFALCVLTEMLHFGNELQQADVFLLVCCA